MVEAELGCALVFTYDAASEGDLSSPYPATRKIDLWDSAYKVPPLLTTVPFIHTRCCMSPHLYFA